MKKKRGLSLAVAERIRFRECNGHVDFAPFQYVNLLQPKQNFMRLARTENTTIKDDKSD